MIKGRSWVLLQKGEPDKNVTFNKKTLKIMSTSSAPARGTARVQWSVFEHLLLKWQSIQNPTLDGRIEQRVYTLCNFLLQQKWQLNFLFMLIYPN